MGHYASEMEGEPFTKKQKIEDEVGQKILKDKSVEYSEIRYCEIEWIVDNPGRRWIIVHYSHSKWGDCIYTTADEEYVKNIRIK